MEKNPNKLSDLDDMNMKKEQINVMSAHPPVTTLTNREQIEKIFQNLSAPERKRYLDIFDLISLYECNESTKEPVGQVSRILVTLSDDSQIIVQKTEFDEMGWLDCDEDFLHRLCMFDSLEFDPSIINIGEPCECHLDSAIAHFDDSQGYFDLGGFLYQLNAYGIGRPSTFSAHINKLITHKAWAEIQYGDHKPSCHKLKLTDEGFKVAHKLKESGMLDLLGISFSNRLEKQLSEIENNSNDQTDVVALIQNLLKEIIDSTISKPVNNWLAHISSQFAQESEQPSSVENNLEQKQTQEVDQRLHVDSPWRKLRQGVDQTLGFSKIDIEISLPERRERYFRRARILQIFLKLSDSLFLEQLPFQGLYTWFIGLPSGSQLWNLSKYQKLVKEHNQEKEWQIQIDSIINKNWPYSELKKMLGMMG